MTRSAMAERVGRINKIPDEMVCHIEQEEVF